MEPEGLVEDLEFGNGEVPNPSGRLGAPVDGRVVVNHEHPVGGHLQIHLEHVGAGKGGLDEGVHRRMRVGDPSPPWAATTGRSSASKSATVDAAGEATCEIAVGASVVVVIATVVVVDGAAVVSGGAVVVVSSAVVAGRGTGVGLLDTGASSLPPQADVHRARTRITRRRRMAAA